MKYILILSLFVFMSTESSAQDKRLIRIARITIDPTHLQAYKSAVKEQIDAAIKTEPGVVMLYCVQDKLIPTNVTVFEIYADSTAYKSHIQTAHFKKYKSGTAHMVKSLELVDVNAIELGQKK